MISKNLFYSQFQINYFDYKQGSLKFLLENYQKVGLDKSIIEYDEKDYLTAIRSDIRQTYFQAIETVFELFFALLPDKNGKVTYQTIEKITLSELPYSKISEIAKNKEVLNYLDDEFIYPDHTKSTLGEFIFYFGLHKSNFKIDFPESLEAIKHGLWILANEFSDRREYNSYKHGLRILPALQTLSVCDVDTLEEQITFDLKDSMTFYSYDKKTKETTYTTKVFDSQKDLRMTRVCSNLIWNMIKFRDVSFNGKLKENDCKFAILFFGKEEINEANKTDVKLQDLKFSIKPSHSC